MSKSYYSVPIVRRELLPLWYEAWDGNMPFGREASRDVVLRQIRIIKAGNNSVDIIEATLLERKARLQLVPLSADGNTPQKIVNRARTGTFASATPTPFNDAVILLDASHRP
jgi:hypothetical protein